MISWVVPSRPPVTSSGVSCLCVGAAVAGIDTGSCLDARARRLTFARHVKAGCFVVTDVPQFHKEKRGG